MPLLDHHDPQGDVAGAAPAPRRPPAANDPAIHPLAPTVFHEAWWLDVVTRGSWQAAQAHHEGRRVGFLPYVLSRRRGFPASVMPMLTHLLGPVVDEGEGAPKTRWLRRQGILDDLIAQLPRVALFSQTCHPETTDVLAFQARGYESFVQFTAEIAPDAEAVLWSQLRDKTRNVIRRAQEQCTVDALADPQEFARFYAANLALAHEHSYVDVTLFAPLFEAAAARRQVRLLGARAGDGRLLAAVFYVWDRRRLWYFLSSRDARAASNGVVSLLVWRGIQMAAERRLVFDFDGIASEGAARFYSGFGPQLRPRFAVYRRSIPFALCTSALDAMRGRSNRNPFTAP